jgi:hypothetical protein
MDMKRASAIISLVFLILSALMLVALSADVWFYELFTKLYRLDNVPDVAKIALTIVILIISIGFPVAALVLGILAYIRTRRIFSVVTSAVSVLLIASSVVILFIVPRPASIREEQAKIPRFEDYPVSETFEGKPAPVDLSSHPDAPNFETRLTEGAEKGPNFAGHYTVIEWGCGTSCQVNAVVDAKTGAVYWGPTTAVGSNYRINSNLFIANPQEGEEIRWVSIEYYKWENNKFIPIYSIPANPPKD